MKRHSSAVLALLLSCGAIPLAGIARSGEKQAHSLSSYRRSELSNAGFDAAGVLALSENGVAVGSIGLNSPARWVNGALDWYDEKLSGEAACVSDSGEWLGGSLDGSTVAFRRHGDEALEELPPLEIPDSETVNSFVTGIRNDGTAVGVCATRSGADLVEHAVRWTPEGEVELLLPNAASSAAYAMNEAGTVVGALRDEPGGHIRPFRWSSGTVDDPASGLDGDLAARAISANGIVVGSGFKEAFGHFWFINRGGQVTHIPLQTEQGGSAPSAVNDAGLVVGNTLDEGPVAWLDGRFFPLNSLVPRSDDASLISARDVNRYSEIAANAYERIGFINERFTANVLTPMQAGADLQGSVADLRVRSTHSRRRKVFTITGKLRVVNAGSEAAPTSIATLELRINGGPASRTRDQRTVRLPALAPGQTQTVPFTAAFLAPRRPTSLLITLDARNRVLEPNEANNLIEAPLGER